MRPLTCLFWKMAVSVLLSLILLACGGGGGGGGGGDGGGTPVVSISIAPTTATISVLATRQFTGTVSNSSNTAVSYSVQEGASGGSVSSSGLYTAPATPGTYHVLATSQADTSKRASATVTVTPGPVIAAFVASASTITTGTSTTLLATFTGGTATISGVSGPITSGTPVSTGTLSATTTFTLTVTDANGATASAQVAVTVVPAPVISSFSASPAIVTSGGTSLLSASFSGGTGSVDQGIGAMVSGVNLSTGALGTNTVFTLTVTNAAGTSVSANTTVTVVTAVPTIAAFSATPAIITLGSASSLSWSVTGQAASAISIDQGIGAISASGNQSVSPGTATTYTLTATNPIGSVTATATVTVVFAPQIASFAASPTTVVAGSSSTLSPVFSQGTGTIVGIGAVTSGNSYNTGAINTTSTFSLVVTNAAGTSLTRNLTVNVDPGTFTAAGGSMSSPRHFHGSTMMANGKVLVVGGSGAGPYLATAEEFDPATNAGNGGFALTAGGLSGVRGYPLSVLLANGKVLVLGGLNGSGTLNTAELYDPVSRTFTASANTMTTARAQASVTQLLNGKILIAGGNNNTGATTISTAELYDPVTDTFTATAGNLGVARWGHVATLLPTGNVFIAGGGAGDTAELYNVLTNTFVPTGNASTSASWYTSTLLQTGQVLLALSGSTGATASLYNPGTGLGSATGSPGLARYSMPSATLLADGRVLLAGNAGAPGAEVAADGELYNAGTGLFRYTGNLGNRGQQSAHLLQNGKVVLIGGFAYSTPSVPGAVLSSAVLFDAGPAVPAPAADATISAPANTTSASTGLTASVPASTGATYIWLIQGGTISAGLGTRTVTFSAGAVGTLTLHCLVISAAGIPAHGQASVTVN